MCIRLGFINFSKRGLLSDTAYLIAFIGIIAFWIAIWYFVRSGAERLKMRQKEEAVGKGHKSRRI